MLAVILLLSSMIIYRGAYVLKATKIESESSSTDIGLVMRVLFKAGSKLGFAKALNFDSLLDSYLNPLEMVDILNIPSPLVLSQDSIPIFSLDFPLDYTLSSSSDDIDNLSARKLLNEFELLINEIPSQVICQAVRFDAQEDKDGTILQPSSMATMRLSQLYHQSVAYRVSGKYLTDITYYSIPLSDLVQVTKKTVNILRSC
ncbi:hypothetical protein V1511DRAFT_506678 [Dipodascopsis uninucleata]